MGVGEVGPEAQKARPKDYTRARKGSCHLLFMLRGQGHPLSLLEEFLAGLCILPWSSLQGR